MPFQFHKDTRQPGHKAHGSLANYSEGRVGQMPCPKAYGQFHAHKHMMQVRPLERHLLFQGL